jgi:hypothetical protein
MEPMPSEPSPIHEHQSDQQWVQYAPPKSKFEELIQNPVAVLAIGIALGVIIVSMRPIVVQTA